GVEVWYVGDPAKPEQPPSNQFYPRPGKKNASVRLGIIPITGGKTTWVKWDHKEDEYLASVHWAKHGPLTVSLQPRTQKELAVWTVNTSTGKLTRLVGQVMVHAWTEIDQHLPYFLPDGAFLWGGGGRLYWYLPKPIELDGEWEGPVYRSLISVD